MSSANSRVVPNNPRTIPILRATSPKEWKLVIDVTTDVISGSWLSKVADTELSTAQVGNGPIRFAYMPRPVATHGAELALAAGSIGNVRSRDYSGVSRAVMRVVTGSLFDTKL